MTDLLGWAGAGWAMRADLERSTSRTVSCSSGALPSARPRGRETPPEADSRLIRLLSTMPVELTAERCQTLLAVVSSVKAHE